MAHIGYVHESELPAADRVPDRDNILRAKAVIQDCSGKSDHSRLFGGDRARASCEKSMFR